MSVTYPNLLVRVGKDHVMGCQVQSANVGRQAFLQLDSIDLRWRVESNETSRLSMCARLLCRFRTTNALPR